MSVAIYTNDEYQRLFNTLVKLHKATHPRDTIRFISSPVIRTQAQMFYDGNEEATTVIEIAKFVRMLCYANQLAAAYTYELKKGRPASIIPIELHEPPSFHNNTYTIAELADKMSMIQYNCISNSGINFIPVDAKESFDIIASQAGTILARRELDNGKNH